MPLAPHRIRPLAALLFFAACSQVNLRDANAEQTKPNVVVLLADDLGWNAVGYHNTDFVTPHIDSIVQSGMELDRFYVAPMCSPTRAGLMTGRYPIRYGLARAVIPPYRDFGLPTDETTLPEALAKLDYEHRGIFGKWHLGHRRAKWHPVARGFTHFHGHYNGAIDYFELTREDVRDWHDNYDASDEQGYATDLIAESVSSWIKDVASDDKPYLCYVPFNAPHSPFQAHEEAIEKFASMKDGNRKEPTRKQIYAAMIWEMDQGIGKILDAIRETGEEDNTIVWFLSDNGGVGNIRENNDPLRGSKLTVYEGGIRVPAAVKWPAKITAGQSSDVLCGYIDVMPTLLDIAGHTANNATTHPVDGISLLNVLTGNNSDQTALNRPWFSYHGQSGEQDEHLAVIADGWKLKVNGPRLKSLEQLSDGTNRVELFHLAKDPNEKANLVDSKTGLRDRLGKMLVDYRKLQPSDSVPEYSEGNRGFIPPANWQLDPKKPNELTGSYQK
ncbi:sulfatase-like hydrolase/transferase [Rhodopirellula sp. MGV]|uniref:sulfatase-like hydrolase/transferase n=1 Tax=Rhodopirellula sp. MGV TaxID=2023130 RepID=UPI000B973B17|nr:sulfatase-like hydrolase/transferase [Rhodopirellula sp. MGV]OYP38929.1 arylsulfatase [Rhodopirellula sp. MGV]PNY37606.1 arylsulfatase [Rhodopirellula baltica]